VPHIILTAEQARVLAEASESIELRDPEGRVVSFVPPLEPADVEAVLRYKQRKGTSGQGVPSAQVAAHLRRLEEINQREPLDEARALDLLRRMRSGEEV
jgi:hypothetical protein